MPDEAASRGVPFVDLVGEYEWHRDEIDSAMRRVLSTGDFVLGSAVAAFEAAFAAYCGTRFSIGVDSGFSALELMLLAHGIGPGDEVITQANTFYSTVRAIEASGATPVLVDADPVHRTIDPALIEGAITESTRAIMPVHLYGHPSDIGAINAIAQRHDLPVLVDACQAVGCRYLSDRSAPLGDGAAFSFYPAKNLGAFGDGGIVVTDRPEIDEKIRMLRNLGSKAKYQHDLRGFNRRLDSLQAAVLEVKLRHLDEATERRRAAARLYGEQLAGLDLVVPAEQGWAESVYHLYVIEVDDRDGLGDHLSACDIGNGVHYPVPIHRQPAFASLGYRHGQFPVTERLADRVLSLPMHPMLQPNDVRTVTEEVRRGLESPQRDRAS